MAPDGRLLDLYAGAPPATEPVHGQPVDGGTQPAGPRASDDWLAALWDGFPRAIRERYAPRALIGEGGMGVVLEAEDRELRRVVAVKGVRDPRGITAEARVRHVREARITARLTHPNIVPVFDTWTDARGNRWCSMLRVPGDTPTLTRWLAAQDAHESPEKRLNHVTQIFLQVCRAIDYAHGQGVLHRDLKAENVLIGPTGEALVADWGVAVAIAESGSADVVGTPGYSAPEQLGQLGPARADVRSDVYALGVLLCELLAGSAALEAALRDRAAPADALPARTPRELVEVVRRATAREPAARFANVPALSGAIEAYLAGELVEGLEYTRRERAVKWIGAHPVAFAVVLSLAALSVQQVRSARGVREALRQAQRELAVANASMAETEIAAGQLALARHHAALGAAAQRAAAPLFVPPQPGANGLLFDAPQPDRLIWACRLEQPAEVSRFTTDGRAIVAASRAVTLWRFPTGGGPPHGATAARSMVWGLDASPAAKVAASVGSTGDVELIDLTSGKTVRTLGKHDASLWAVAFSPDGRRLATGSFDKTVRLWDVSGARPPLVLKGHTSQVWCVAWSADGRLVASGAADGNDLRVWDATTGALLAQLPGCDQALTVALDPTGELLAVGSGEAGVPVFWWRTGKVAARVPAPSRTQSLAFSKAGLLATGGQDNAARVWDLDLAHDAPRQLLELRGHEHWISMLEFSPRGDFLVTSSQDRGVRLWDVRPARAAPFNPPGRLPELAVFASDGALATADDTDLRIFSRAGDPLHRIALGGAKARALHVDATGTGSAVLWDAEALWLQRYRDHAPAGPRERLASAGSQSAAEFDPTGTRVAVAMQAGGGKVWSVSPKLELIRTFDSAEVTWRGLALDPVGRWVATGGTDKLIHLWALDGGVDRALEGHAESVTSLAFSRDGRQLASGSQDFQVRVWELSTGTSRVIGDHRTDHVWSLCFDADAQLVAAGGPSGLLYLHDVATGTLVDKLRTASESVTSLSLSPDGTQLACGGGQRASVFDLAAWRDPQRRIAEIVDASLFTVSGEEQRLMPRPAAVQLPISLPRDARQDRLSR